MEERRVEAVRARIDVFILVDEEVGGGLCGMFEGDVWSLDTILSGDGWLTGLVYALLKRCDDDAADDVLQETGETVLL